VHIQSCLQASIPQSLFCETPPPLQELVRVLKNFKSVRDPLRPRSSYIEQVNTQATTISLVLCLHSDLQMLTALAPCRECTICDLQLKRDIMTYYEYNDFLAGYILNLFPFDEAVEFIQVHLADIKAVDVLLPVPDAPRVCCDLQPRLLAFCHQQSTMSCRRTRRSGLSHCAPTHCERGDAMSPER
jgi:hypothetical protein